MICIRRASNTKLPGTSKVPRSLLLPQSLTKESDQISPTLRSFCFKIRRADLETEHRMMLVGVVRFELTTT